MSPINLIVNLRLQALKEEEAEERKEEGEVGEGAGAELNRVGPAVELSWKAVGEGLQADPGEGLQADPGEGPPPEGDGNNRV